MALPTQTDIATMDYSAAGQPFVKVPAKSTVDTTTMDYSFGGQPFVVNPFGGAAAPAFLPKITFF